MVIRDGGLRSLARHLDFTEGQQGLRFHFARHVFRTKQPRVSLYRLVGVARFHLDTGARREDFAHERRPRRVPLEAVVIGQRRRGVPRLGGGARERGQRFVFLRRARVPLEQVAVNLRGVGPAHGRILGRGAGRGGELRFGTVRQNHRAGLLRCGQRAGLAQQSFAQGGIRFFHAAGQGPNGAHGQHVLLLGLRFLAHRAQARLEIALLRLAFVVAVEGQHHVLHRISLLVVAALGDGRPVSLDRFFRLVFFAPGLPDLKKRFRRARAARIGLQVFLHQVAQPTVVLLELEHLGQLELRVLVETPRRGLDRGVHFLPLVRLGLGQQGVAEQDARLSVLFALGKLFQVILQLRFRRLVFLHRLRAIGAAEGRRPEQCSLGILFGVRSQHLARFGEFFGEGQRRTAPVVRRLGQFVIGILLLELPESLGRFVIALGQQLREPGHEKSARRLLGRCEFFAEERERRHGIVVFLRFLLRRAPQVDNQGKAFRIGKILLEKLRGFDGAVVTLDRHPTLQGAERGFFHDRIRFHLPQHVVEQHGALAVAVLHVESRGQTEADRSVEGRNLLEVGQLFFHFAHQLLRLRARENIRLGRGLDRGQTLFGFLEFSFLVGDQTIPRPDVLQGADGIARPVFCEQLFAQRESQRLESRHLVDPFAHLRPLLGKKFERGVVLTRFDQAMQLKHRGAPGMPMLRGFADGGKRLGRLLLFFPGQQRGGGEQFGVRTAGGLRKLLAEFGQRFARLLVIAGLQEGHARPEREIFPFFRAHLLDLAGLLDGLDRVVVFLQLQERGSQVVAHAGHQRCRFRRRTEVGEEFAVSRHRLLVTLAVVGAVRARNDIARRAGFGRLRRGLVRRARVRDQGRQQEAKSDNAQTHTSKMCPATARARGENEVCPAPEGGRIAPCRKKPQIRRRRCSLGSGETAAPNSEMRLSSCMRAIFVTTRLTAFFASGRGSARA